MAASRQTVVRVTRRVPAVEARTHEDREDAGEVPGRL
jgi:hypothetical protein